MQKTTMYGLTGLLVLGLVAAGAFAYSGMGRNVMVGDEDMQAALETGDYDAYVSAMTARNENFVENEVTQERFDRISTRYQERLEHREQMQANHELIEAAMDEGYDSFMETLNSLENKPWFADQITEENFDKFVELHDLREQGRAIAEELGLEGPGRMQSNGQGRFGAKGGLARGGCMQD